MEARIEKLEAVIAQMAANLGDLTAALSAGHQYSQAQTAQRGDAAAAAAEAAAGGWLDAESSDDDVASVPKVGVGSMYSVGSMPDTGTSIAGRPV